MRSPAVRRALKALKLLCVVLVASVLAGCGQVFAREEAEMKVAFIAPSSRSAADQERDALRIAFAEANRRRVFGSRRIVLEERFSPQDIAVIAGRPSSDEDWAQQIAFLRIGRRSTSEVLQPVQYVDCTAPHAESCAQRTVARQAAFERSFRDVTGRAPTAEAYVAYAEAQSLFAAIRRLLAEDELSDANLRRALVFGEFSTVLGDLRYTMPPNVTDEVAPASWTM